MAAAGALALGGCADLEGARADGPAPGVSAPDRLWPDLHPGRGKAQPPEPSSSDDPAVVEGAPWAPGDDLRRVDVLALVKADIAAQARQDKGTGQLLVDHRVAERLRTCTDRCRLRPAAFHDLTGDGRPELITAVDTAGRRSELRVYTVRDHRIVRILGARLILDSVQVTDSDLVVSEPAAPGYTSSSDYTWDGHKLVRSVQVLEQVPSSSAST